MSGAGGRPGGDPGPPGRDSPPGTPDRDVAGDGIGGEDLEGLMAGFRRAGDGASARFTAAQAGIIRTLVSQIAELVGGDQAPGPDAGDRAGPAVPPAGHPQGPEPRAADPRAGGEQAAQPFGMDELSAILGTSGPTAPPADPVLARLLPDAYRDDPDAAGEFRRYTEQGLRSGKVAAARTVLATLPARGGRVRLSAQDAQVWLRTLNDVRLALGVRLQITEDYEEEVGRLDPADPRTAFLQVYDWLTFLQETLVRALW